MVLEDLHWADADSLNLLDDLAHRLDGSAALVVVATRPTLLDERRQRPVGGRAVPDLRLAPLEADMSRALIEDVLQHVADVPDSLVELIAHRAEGNPFFVEELIKMLIDDGVVVPGACRAGVARGSRTTRGDVGALDVDRRARSASRQPRRRAAGDAAAGRGRRPGLLGCGRQFDGPGHAGDRHRRRAARGLRARTRLSPRSIVALDGRGIHLQACVAARRHLRDGAPPRSTAPARAGRGVAGASRRRSAERVPGDDRRPSPARRRRAGSRRDLCSGGPAGVGTPGGRPALAGCSNSPSNCGRRARRHPRSMRCSTSCRRVSARATSTLPRPSSDRCCRWNCPIEQRALALYYASWVAAERGDHDERAGAPRCCPPAGRSGREDGPCVERSSEWRGRRRTPGSSKRLGNRQNVVLAIATADRRPTTSEEVD